MAGWCAGLGCSAELISAELTESGQQLAEDAFCMKRSNQVVLGWPTCLVILQ